MIELEFDGYEELKATIALAPDLALKAASPAMSDAMTFLQGQIPEYPAAIPDSRYKRTGLLGRRWTTEVENTPVSVIGTIGNNTPYAPWVVGPEYPGLVINGREMYQAKVHADRWWQFMDVIEAHESEAWKEFTDTFWDEFLTAMRKQANGGR